MVTSCGLLFCALGRRQSDRRSGTGDSGKGCPGNGESPGAWSITRADLSVTDQREPVKPVARIGKSGAGRIGLASGQVITHPDPTRAIPRIGGIAGTVKANQEEKRRGQDFSRRGRS